MIAEPLKRLPSIGTRTARDLLFGVPPDQLAEPYLTPEDATVIFGPGGTGKGVFTCHLINRLVRAGHVVLLVDFEGHEREWGSRLRGLGLSDEELDHVHYRAPFGPDWLADRGSLDEVADLLRVERYRLDATYLVVDSYSVATSSGDAMGGKQAAQEYFTALTRIGLPSLTIAHVAGAAEKWPARPFGSVFVHNLARETWAVEAIGDQAEDSDPDLIAFGPHTVELELRNRKANGRAKYPPQFVTFSFFPDGTIETSSTPPRQSFADLAAAVLAVTPNLNVKQIAAAIKEDTARIVSEQYLRLDLSRNPQRFVMDPTKRPHTWATK